MSSKDYYQVYLGEVSNYLDASARRDAELKRLDGELNKQKEANKKEEHSQIAQLFHYAEQAGKRFESASLLLEKADLGDSSLLLPKKVRPVNTQEDFFELDRRQSELITQLEKAVRSFKEEKAARSLEQTKSAASSVLAARNKALQQSNSKPEVQPKEKGCLGMAAGITFCIVSLTKLLAHLISL